jgi:hypothetical protein
MVAGNMPLDDVFPSFLHISVRLCVPGPDIVDIIIFVFCNDVEIVERLFTLFQFTTVNPDTGGRVCLRMLELTSNRCIACYREFPVLNLGSINCYLQSILSPTDMH